MKSCGIHLNAISQEVFKMSILDMNLKTNNMVDLTGNSKDIYLWYKLENDKFQITVASARDEGVKKPIVCHYRNDQQIYFEEK